MVGSKRLSNKRKFETPVVVLKGNEQVVSYGAVHPPFPIFITAGPSHTDPLPNNF
jgi:hypothetical protein